MKRGLIGKKRAQSTMSLPFGIIFSILLIIVFIGVAFIAVTHFLDIGKCSQAGNFYKDLQKEVDNVWTSQMAENIPFKIDLPSGAEKICFVNSSALITDAKSYDDFGNYIPENNLFILPSGSSCNMPSIQIKHIDITKITNTTNPKCFDVSRTLKLKKDFYDKYVTIE